MNKLTKIQKLALFAALPAAVLVANSAMAGIDVYGKINLTVQKNSADQDDGLATVTNGDVYDNYTLDTNASRLGFKSSADLGSTGLKGIAKLEYEVDVDDGATVLGQRNIYAGVQGGFGALIAGKFDTPMKESQGKADLFNDYILGDIKNVLLVGEDRASNIIMYSTPKFENGIGVNFAFMPGEEQGIAGSDENNGIADYISANIHYDSEMLYLALAHNTASAPTAATAAGAEITRLVAQMKLDAFTVGAIYQMADSADNNNTTAVNAIGNYTKTPFGQTLNWSTNYKDQDGYILNGSYTMGDNTFKVQYGTSTATTVTGVATDVKNGDLDITLVSIGYDYKLDKNAMIFAYYSDYQAEHETVANVKREVNANTFAVGYELKF